MTLGFEPFLVARGLDAGASLNRLNAQDLDASVWGVRDPNRQSTIASRCARFGRRLDCHVLFSHSTAALVYGAPLTLALEHDLRLHVTVRSPARAPHATGLAGHSLSLGEHETVIRGGLRLTSPERTWCDLASQLDLLNLVAAGDWLLSGDRRLTTASRLANCLDRHPLLKHGALAREALGHLDGGAESRPESMVRVVLALGGLPPPKINHSLIDTEHGRVVRPDFEFSDYRVLVEYQGDYHRLTQRQWRRDMTRRSRLEAAGWTVIEINADDLTHPTELVTRVARQLMRHGWKGRVREVSAQIVW